MPVGPIATPPDPNPLLNQDTQSAILEQVLQALKLRAPNYENVGPQTRFPTSPRLLATPEQAARSGIGLEEAAGATSGGSTITTGSLPDQRSPASLGRSTVTPAAPSSQSILDRMATTGSAPSTASPTAIGASSVKPVTQQEQAGGPAASVVGAAARPTTTAQQAGGPQPSGNTGSGMSSVSTGAIPSPAASVSPSAPRPSIDTIAAPVTSAPPSSVASQGESQILSGMAAVPSPALASTAPPTLADGSVRPNPMSAYTGIGMRGGDTWGGDAMSQGILNGLLALGLEGRGAQTQTAGGVKDPNFSISGQKNRTPAPQQDVSDEDLLMFS